MTSNSNIDEILGKIFAYGIDWHEYKDTSENDHSVSTFAGKIKAGHKAALKQAIQQLLDEAYKKGYIDGGIAEITK